MLLPCRLKTRISTASSATNMRPSAWEYPTSRWVNFQSATLGQFSIGGNMVTAAEICRPKGSKLAMDSEGLFGLTPSFSPPQRQRVKANVVAFSLARMKSSLALSPLNEAVVPLDFEAPENWDGGWVKIRIVVASLASNAKPRWITVKRYLEKRPAPEERADMQVSQEAAA
jgi:hypothetical protein